ncbi:hypothetical protein Mal15_04770 [Stieleria maiorica]|uniref:Uncharacterized protein n=1 Tax=Stieleria maiorica TaxID=2795974 RepID=A0A5B9M6V6_9BACT|nr:hypothetical protein [Stieleria maiorica]QEF96449.1 hypothetical protein Mal15_04770 [Stieleria maiorica]
MGSQLVRRFLSSDWSAALELCAGDRALLVDILRALGLASMGELAFQIEQQASDGSLSNTGPIAIQLRQQLDAAVADARRLVDRGQVAK